MAAPSAGRRSRRLVSAPLRGNENPPLQEDLECGDLRRFGFFLLLRSLKNKNGKRRRSPHSTLASLITRRFLLAHVLAASQLLTDSRDLLAVELDALLAQAELHVLIAGLAAEYRQRFFD